MPITSFISLSFSSHALLMSYSHFLLSVVLPKRISIGRSYQDEKRVFVSFPYKRPYLPKQAYLLFAIQ